MVACTPLGFEVQRAAPLGKSWASALLVGADRVGVEDHDVGGVADEQQAAVGEAAQRGGDGGDLPHALLEGEAPPLAHPVLEEPRVGLGAVVAVEVGAAVGRAHDHVRVVLGDLGALDPLGRLGLPEELDGEVLGRGDVEEGIGGVHASLGGDVHERAADQLLVLRLGHLVDVQHRPAPAAAAWDRPPGRGSGWSTESRTASRNAGSAISASRSSTVAASVKRRLSCSAPSYSLVPAARLNVRLNGFDIAIEYTAAPRAGGLVDEALGVVPTRRGCVDLRAGAEALDDHRHPRQERHLDEQLLVVGRDAAHRRAGQVGERAAARAPGGLGERLQLVEARRGARAPAGRPSRSASASGWS